MSWAPGLALALLALSCAVRFTTALPAYTQTASWTSSNFLDQFDFFTGDDPTHGYVDYVDRLTASSGGLVPIVNNAQQLRADHTAIVSGNARGRRSVRLESKQQFNGGLFLLDLAHVPVGCGTWPAYWFLGPNWPSSGEVDVIEGVHNATSNVVSFHTGAGCTQAGARQQSATILSLNCSADAVGCGNRATTPASYGAEFNANGGGVYATLWDASGIAIWLFPRPAIPADIVQNAPRPDRWPTPMANLTFAPACTSSHFASMQIVFDLAFCGDDAGDPSVWAGSGCARRASNCTTFVRNNPSSFVDAYFAVNSLGVFQDASGAPGASPSSPSRDERGVAALVLTILVVLMCGMAIFCFVLVMQRRHRRLLFQNGTSEGDSERHRPPAGHPPLADAEV
ncbi:GH16 domain-containing protein [Plasmodiophora brassicae]|uniref:GH16 domain-containing protein n=1 Tax=Plasmodiophora brassicae TaxID=37360 RepID=A0A0G4IZB3_PLABS|nr:hypothetical protein PBRA_001678 [Plasmodiophora brassicae]SPQ93883.1 unnamed protein product [Plasmodiophora brassicae]